MRLRAIFSCCLWLPIGVSAFAQGKKIAPKSEAVTPSAESRKVEKESDDDPIARERWFMQGRTGTAANPASVLLKHAFEQKRVLVEQGRLSEFTSSANGNIAPRRFQMGSNGPMWTQIGPTSLASDAGTQGYQDYGRVSGRVISVAVDQTDTTGNTVYIGAATGGVWKSVNAANSNPAQVSWTSLTDNQVSLVAGAIAIAPNNHNLILVGTGEGNSSGDSYYGQGILRSTDGGNTWTQITTADGGAHTFSGLAFTSFAFSTANPNLVVAATAGAAEYYGPAPSQSVVTRGLYYSQDAGVTWHLANETDAGVQVGAGTQPASATQVVYDPVNGTFYAGIRAHGIYQSTDGANFSRMLMQPFSAWTGGAGGNCPTTYSSSTCPLYRANLAVQPTTGALFVIAVDSSDAPPANTSGNPQGLAMATVTQLAQGTWTQILTYDPTNPTAAESGILDRISGASVVEQGGYNLWLAAMPNGATDTNLFVGAVDIFRCDLSSTQATVGGATAYCAVQNSWANLTKVYDQCATGSSSPLSPYAHVHPDQHAVDFLHNNTQTMYFGNDGGVYRTLNGAPGDGCGSAPNPFQNLNAGLGSLTQFVSFSQHPSDPTVTLGGTQDNGSPATYGSLGANWQSVNGGDGGYNLIDPNPGLDGSGNMVAAGDVWYTANTDVSIQRCTSGTQCSEYIFGLPASGYSNSNIDNVTVGGDSGDFYTPYILEPSSTSLLYVGTCRLWRGPGDGGTTYGTGNNTHTDWSSSGMNIGALSPIFDDLVSGATPATSCSNETMVRSIAAGGPMGPASIGGSTYNVSQVVYVGMSASGTAAGGHIFATRNSTATTPAWVDVTPTALNPSNSPISDLAVDPRDPTGATIYATIMGFGGSHVIESTNYGQSWTDVSGNLPNAPADAIALDPNNQGVIYVGTDLGVFYTQGQNLWSPYGQNMPNVPATRLRVFNGQTLRVSTYGRGVWQAPLAQVQPDFAITLNQSSLAALTGNSVTFTGTLTSINGYSNPVTVSCMGGQTSAPSTCGSATVTPTVSGASFSISAKSATAGNYQFNIQASDGNGDTHSANASLTVTASGPILSVSPSALSFRSQLVGTASAQQAITLSNSGNATLSISSIATSGDFAETNNCPSSLAPNATCSVAVAFQPASAGSRMGTLTIVNSSALSSVTLNLTGTGADFQLSNGGSATQTVKAGTNATYNMSLSSVSGFSGAVSLACSGAPTGSTCTVNPASLQMSNNTGSFAVTVTTSGAAKSGSLGWIGFLSVIPLILLRRRLRHYAACVAVMCSVAVLCFGMAACGSSSGNSSGGPSANVTGTPAGTYNIVVTATSQSVTHQTTLTLVVQ